MVSTMIDSPSTLPVRSAGKPICVGTVGDIFAGAATNAAAVSEQGASVNWPGFLEFSASLRFLAAGFSPASP